jgi:hypothetical protein
MVFLGLLVLQHLLVDQFFELKSCDQCQCLKMKRCGILLIQMPCCKIQSHTETVNTESWLKWKNYRFCKKI